VGRRQLRGFGLASPRGKGPRSTETADEEIAQQISELTSQLIEMKAENAKQLNAKDVVRCSCPGSGSEANIEAPSCTLSLGASTAYRSTYRSPAPTDACASLLVVRVSGSLVLVSQ
jgi:hypothetical protein